MNVQAKLPILRALARQRTAMEVCELCATELEPLHSHLFEPTNRRLLCCCRPCLLLFEGRDYGRYRVVPEESYLLTDFQMTDGQWEGFQIPINLAFFYRGSISGRISAIYPSPAGPTESLLSLESWEVLENDNPILKNLEPDVEALLVNRVGETREHYRVGIDECYKLVGVIRRNWHGFSGGSKVWEEIDEFFNRLKEKSAPGKGQANA